jgi:hypothetical protein
VIDVLVWFGVVFVAICLITGTVLIWIGSAAAFQYPICGCGYDLRHLPETTTRCPECGRTWIVSETPRSARTIRHTVRHPRLVNAGIVLCIAPFAAAALGLLLAMLRYAFG